MKEVWKCRCPPLLWQQLFHAHVFGYHKVEGIAIWSHNLQRRLVPSCFNLGAEGHFGCNEVAWGSGPVWKECLHALQILIRYCNLVSWQFPGSLLIAQFCHQWRREHGRWEGSAGLVTAGAKGTPFKVVQSWGEGTELGMNQPVGLLNIEVTKRAFIRPFHSYGNATIVDSRKTKKADVGD